MWAPGNLLLSFNSSHDTCRSIFKHAKPLLSCRYIHCSEYTKFRFPHEFFGSREQGLCWFLVKLAAITHWIPFMKLNIFDRRAGTHLKFYYVSYRKYFANGFNLHKNVDGRLNYAWVSIKTPIIQWACYIITLDEKSVELVASGDIWNSNMLQTKQIVLIWTWMVWEFDYLMFFK